MNLPQAVMFGHIPAKPASACDWCDEPASELRVWTGGGWDKDHICADCFALHDGENSFTDLELVAS